MKKIAFVLNTLVILSGIAIIALMSVEVLLPKVVITYKEIVEFHFIICLIFLLDYVVRLMLAKDKWRFARRNILFLIISIPYLSIFEWSGIAISGEASLIVRYVPFIRAAYGFAIVLGYFTRSKITNLFFTYIAVIIATAYFAGLVFYSIEKGVNAEVHSFGDSLWWAFMDLTTVGSNIYAVTPVGRVLSVVLAAAGMMMFPIFTAYIASKFASFSDSKSPQTKESSDV